MTIPTRHTVRALLFTATILFLIFSLSAWFTPAMTEAGNENAAASLSLPATPTPRPTITPRPTATPIKISIPTRTPIAIPTSRIPTRTATPSAATATPTPNAITPTATPASSVSHFGVWIGGGDQSNVDALTTAGARWTRVMLFWSTVEPTRGSYDFSAYDSLLQSLSRAGITTIVEIRGNPAWAAPTICGPIDDLDGFQSFVQTTVSRYSGSGYNVKNYEFYNEPDCKSAALAQDLMGCWGNDPARYAQMLARAKRAVSAADPASRVLFGGLAYDSYSNATCGGECYNLDFLDQVLGQSVDGHPASDYFDVANVHFYSSQGGNWSSYGSDLVGKVTALRQVLAKHGVSKPVALTEASWTTSADAELQARYVPKMLARALSANLYAALWFSITDWQGADFLYGLLDVNRQPKPAYTAYKTATRELGEATAVRALTSTDVGGVGGVEGYAVTVGGRQHWVLWAHAAGTTDGSASQATIKIPAGVIAVYDKSGNAVAALAGQSYTLGDSPVYLRY